jgi:hypothetical protein
VDAKDILINLSTCLPSNNLDFFLNCEQNWVGDLRIGCKPFSSLVKIIGVDLELEEFERTLERDRIFEKIVYYF